MILKPSFFTLTILFLVISCKDNNSNIAQNNEPEIDSLEVSHEVVVPDLSIPWGMDFLPDGSILITEKDGRLIHFKDDQKTEIEGVPQVTVMGQGGLLDIKLHPDYETNGWLYLSYAHSENGDYNAHTAIARAKLDGNTLVNHELLYKATPDTGSGIHFGSRIEFDNDGYLYFSIGERGNHPENPQDITRDGGKIYRLNDDGSIPQDNPFVNEPNAKAAIYSYGHRNPQGMEKHPETDAIWTHEHGPQGGDEINIVEAGNNYGWPEISYGIDYDGTIITEHTEMEGMEQPLHYWVPSIAPSGMAFITGDVYPSWEGNLLVGSLKFQYVSLCKMDGHEVVSETKLLEGLGRVRSIEQGPDGYMYAGIEDLGVVKIVPEG